MSRSRFSVVCALVLLTACDPEVGAPAGSSGGSSWGTTSDVTGEVSEAPAPVVREAASVASGAGPASAAVEAGPAAASVEAEPPLGYRVGRKGMVVLAEPRWGAAMRGRIDMGQPFAIYELAAGKGCTGEGWARVDQLGYVCLRDAAASRRAGKPLPLLGPDKVVPYIYAKPRADRSGALLRPVARHRSAAALGRGDAAGDWLQPHHQYAFVESRRMPEVGVVLLDRSRRAVKADELEFERPSNFAGRELGERPVPAATLAAWSAEAPTPVRATPGLTGEVVGRVEYHREIAVAPTPVRRDGVDWYALQGETAGYVSDEDIRRWTPGAPLAGVGADELWLDVELEEQTLTVLRGATPLFVTLVSSGAGDNPTPRGLYRIWHKQALGDMRSLPGDPDSYTVEEVPWVQYFHRRFAFHAAFWHNKFGRKRSHGCINLSPRDAARVFGQTAPAMPGGWTFVYEHEDEPGTTVRIRRGDEVVPDRRRALGEAVAADEPRED